jgi:L-cysteate sulfo-lyase
MKPFDTSRLSQHLDKFDRRRLGHFPTPFEPARRLMSSSQGPSIFVKRDDASGLGGGGNKVRALEYLIPAVLAAGADTIVTAGVVQSNSVRQVAAAAAKTGLACHFGMITDRVPKVDCDYAETGNIFLDKLYGATYEPMSIKHDRSLFLQAVADRLSLAGRRPYIVPYGCANALGATGYLRCALEIAQQAESAGVALTHVVHASGTGGTQAGLIARAAHLRSMPTGPTSTMELSRLTDGEWLRQARSVRHAGSLPLRWNSPPFVRDATSLGRSQRIPSRAEG